MCIRDINENGDIHLSETDVVGKKFRGEIKHVENPKKPGEIKDKIIEIELKEDSGNEESQEDDIPF